MSFASLLATRSLIGDYKSQSLALQNRVRNFLRNQVVTTQLGFGTYRAHHQVGDHHQALLVALQSGVNLIDTAPNYTLGGAHSLISKVLAEVKGKYSRDNFILVGKAGYIQGEKLSVVQEMGSGETPFEDILKLSPDCWHCIEPNYLKQQLDWNLEELQVDGLDVYLIHNPEYFFSWHLQQNPGSDLDDLRTRFYANLTASFCAMENLVQEGKIKFYGISSNTLAHSAKVSDSVQLHRVLSCAKEAARQVHGSEKKHHFQVIQFPLNLVEHQGFSEENQPDGMTLLEYASKLGLDVLLNRPLNGFREDRFWQLRFRLEEKPEGSIEEITNTIQSVESKVDRMVEEVSLLKEAVLECSSQFHFFKVGSEFVQRSDDFEDQEHLNSAIARYFMPHTHRSVDLLGVLSREMDNALLGEWQPVSLCEEYLSAMGGFEQHLQYKYAKKHNEFLREQLKDFSDFLSLDEESFLCSLMNFYASLPGKPVVLNGMRSLDHVRSSTEFLIEESWSEEKLEKMKEKLKEIFPC